MRRRLTVLLATGAVAAAPAAGATASTPIAHTACRSATIGGQHKCIARGQFCKHRYASQYRRYGLSCSYVDRNGRYHLR